MPRTLLKVFGGGGWWWVVLESEFSLVQRLSLSLDQAEQFFKSKIGIHGKNGVGARLTDKVLEF